MTVARTPTATIPESIVATETIKQLRGHQVLRGLATRGGGRKNEFPPRAGRRRKPLNKNMKRYPNTQRACKQTCKYMLFANDEPAR